MAMSPDLTADLWLKIDQLHLNFLKSEENTAKLEIRKKLEGYIHQYLCLVPQERKFCNPLTSVILFESARWISDFSALKAARAFEAVEKYAANLINQPWRKEFKEIKQYGGFYKHQVESYLNSPERLFHLMGYVSTGQQSLVLDGPVDLDKVTVVARDCVLAYVECQIVVNILQGVTAQFPCRWDEVLEFRRNHIGSPEQATRTMLYQKNQLHFAAQAQGFPQPYYNPYGSFGTPTNGGPNHVFHAPMTPLNGVVPTGNLVDLSSPGPFQNGSLNRMMMMGVKNGNGLNDEQESSGSSNSTVTGAYKGPIPLTIKQFEVENKRKTLLAEAAKAAASANDAQNPLESWDYVYRQLESIGYTKDQGERPDVLDILSKVGMNPQHRMQLEQRLKEQQRLQQHMQQVNSDSHHRMFLEQRLRDQLIVQQQYQKDESCQTAKQPQRPASTSTSSSRRPQAPAKSPTPPALPQKGVQRARPPPQEPAHAAEPEPPKLPEKKRQAQPVAAEPKYEPRSYDYDEESEEEEFDDDDFNVVDESKEWQCTFCTFLNSLEVEICDMCSKSRRSVASRTHSSRDDHSEFHSQIEDEEAAAAVESEDENEEDEEDATGKVQCPKCTFLNPNHLNICTVCGASLHKAPINPPPKSHRGRSRPQSRN